MLFFCFVLLATGIGAQVAQACLDPQPPEPPLTLYGVLSLNGSPAPDGAVLRLYVNGAYKTSTTIPASGAASGSGNYRVDVPGLSSGDLITFGVDHFEIAEEVTYTSSGAHEVDLSDRAFTYTFDVTPVNGSSQVAFPAHDGGPALALNANGVDLGNTNVTIRANQECTTIPGDEVWRCFQISPTNTSERNATVTFYFYLDQIPAGQSCAAMKAYYWIGSTWQDLDPTGGNTSRSCSGSPYWLQVSGVSSFSPFVLKSDGPTTLESIQFTAPADRMTGRTFGISILILAFVLVVIFTRKP